MVEQWTVNPLVASSNLAPGVSFLKIKSGHQMISLLSALLAILAVITAYMTFAAIGFGSVLAMIISWNRNGSVMWAVIHGWFSWFYVIYYCLQRQQTPNL